MSVWCKRLIVIARFDGEKLARRKMKAVAEDM